MTLSVSFVSVPLKRLKRNQNKMILNNFLTYAGSLVGFLFVVFIFLNFPLLNRIEYYASENCIIEDLKISHVLEFRP